MQHRMQHLLLPNLFQPSHMFYKIIMGLKKFSSRSDGQTELFYRIFGSRTINLWAHSISEIIWDLKGWMLACVLYWLVIASTSLECLPLHLVDIEQSFLRHALTRSKCFWPDPVKTRIKSKEKQAEEYTPKFELFFQRPCLYAGQYERASRSLFCHFFWLRWGWGAFSACQKWRNKSYRTEKE